MLLAWYDAHARVLPWRTGPDARRNGARPDPYRVWLSEIMLQQTTVATVRDRFTRFVARWPDVKSLAAAEDDEVLAAWAGLGYYARARNLLRTAREVVRMGGFPDTRDDFLQLPGIGPYTAAAMAAILHDEPVAAIDGNVRRVVARLFAIETPLKQAEAEIRALAGGLVPKVRAGDHVQAMMDLGATICTPRAPSCAICPLRDHCLAHRRGIADELPRRAARPPRPERAGTAWALLTPAGWLMERRPENGLLGGMWGFPGTGWDGRTGAPPAVAHWHNAGRVEHVFTHFRLSLDVRAARAEITAPPGLVTRRIGRGTLTTLMRKVHDAARAALDEG